MSHPTLKLIHGSEEIIPLIIARAQSDEYFAQHMTKIRESLRQKKQPRVMETQKRRLLVNWEDEVGFCGLQKKHALKTQELCTEQCYTCPYSWF